MCIQNHKQDYFDHKQLSAPHHTAFLVGKLAGLAAPDPGNDDKGTRKKLVFSEYAEIDIADKWPGNRNPVFYGDLEEMGIDVTALDFQPMPIQELVAPPADKPQPLTIVQAKAGLALCFGVLPADIEIVIRGCLTKSQVGLHIRVHFEQRFGKSNSDKAPGDASAKPFKWLAYCVHEVATSSRCTH